MRTKNFVSYAKASSSLDRCARKNEVHAPKKLKLNKGNLHREGNNGPYGTSHNVPLGQLPARQNLPRQVSAAKSELVTVEGVVKTITMENKMSGYLVAKIKVRRRHHSPTQPESCRDG